MKDPRCLMGRHRYQERHTVDTQEPSTDVLYLQCARCGREADAQRASTPGDPPDKFGGIHLGGGGEIGWV